MKNSNKTVDFNVLRKQFAGSLYSELIEEHIRKMEEKAETAFLGYMQSFSEIELLVGSELIDEINRKCRLQGFLRRDSREVFDYICSRFQEMMQMKGGVVDDQAKFNMFQVVTLNLAISARDDMEGFYEHSGSEQTPSPLTTKQIWCLFFGIAFLVGNYIFIENGSMGHWIFVFIGIIVITMLFFIFRRK